MQLGFGDNAWPGKAGQAALDKVQARLAPAAQKLRGHWQTVTAGEPFPLPARAMWLLYPLALFYYEVMFKLSCAGRFTAGNMATILLFSASYGALCTLLAVLPHSERAQRVLAPVLLAVLALPYLIEHFVFQEFRVFYDLNTVLGGAGDAVGGFAADIFHLLFSPPGLLRIFLFLLPAAAVALFWRRLPALRLDADGKLHFITAAVCAYAAALVLIAASPLPRRLYRREYNFQTAIQQFGLLSALRLDAADMLFGGELVFEPEILQGTAAPAPDTADTAATAETAETAPAQPAATPAPTYRPNALDIDFAALSAGADGTLADLDAYVAAQTPTMQNEYTGLFAGKNLIFISAEALCREVIDPERTPTLYRMATKGIRFTDYYQPASAGTTGGECANLLGVLPMLGGKSVKQAANYALPLTMGHQLDRQGYYGMAFHNNDYTYYSRDVTHNALGYSQGFMGYGNGMEEYVTKQWPQSDLEMIEGTLPLYLDHQPFNIYYMSVSGHSPYDLKGNAMARKHWDAVQDLPCSDKVRCYLAANIELDEALEYLINALEQAGIADDTVICVAPDHFPYGLDVDSALGQLENLEELYGMPVDDYLVRDHSCLLLWSGCLEDAGPITVDAPTFSPDILPTLSNLFGVPYDSRLLPGRDVFSGAEALVFNVSHDWKTELGTYIAATGVFTPADPDADIPDGYVDRIRTVVRNKLNYCRGVLNNDYFAHVLQGTELAP